MAVRLMGGLLIVAAAVATLAGQAGTREARLHGRRALVLENDRMQVSVLPGGGFIGEVRFKSDDPRMAINVMRVPHYQTIDPFAYDLARDGARYGTGMQRRLMSGYMGHFLTFPHFAAASAAELEHDYGQHGEAIAVEWQTEAFESTSDRARLSSRAELPKTLYTVHRTVELPAGETVAYVEESVENRAPFGRPMQWGQHVTFGPPFVTLAKNFVDASVEQVLVRSGQTSTGSRTWPTLTDPDGSVRDLRAFSGRSSTWLMDGSRPHAWFTMYNADYPILVGYVFASAANRWVLDWQEHQRNQEVPWDGQVIARGLCIGDSVISGLANAVRRGSELDTPLFSWIDAGERRTQSYLFFLAEIPAGFKGVADLKIERGTITIVERDTGSTIEVRASGIE